jgi:eukaryotic-like serine/threonine-protein kinase
MGSVYVVEHVHTGEQLALKVLLSQVGASQEHIERFKREARASAVIKSEHVVRVTDSDVAPELNGAPFLVMELLEGQDLETLTESTQGPIAPSIVLDWLRQVARALDKAHSFGLVHRDLKPENLFLTRREDGSPLVKILDYGLVKMVENAGQTATGEILGTPRYMAPEQARGDVEQIGPGTDRWALGLIAYKLLTGEEYWNAKTVHHLLAQIVYEEVAPPSSRGSRLGAGFDRWFLTACHRDPSARFSSAAEQVEALADALGAPSIAPAPRGSEQSLAGAASSNGGTRPSRRPSDPSEHAATLRASSVESLEPPRKPATAALAGGAIALLLVAGVVGFVASSGKKDDTAKVAAMSAQAPSASVSAAATTTGAAVQPGASTTASAAPVEPHVTPSPSESAAPVAVATKKTPVSAGGAHKTPVPPTTKTDTPPPKVNPLDDQR